MTEIVVGVDGSPASTAAVRWAAARAALGSARLTLIGAVPHWANEMSEWGPYASVGQWAREDADQALAAAGATAREIFPDCLIGTSRRGGEARSVLTEASARATMLVVGSRGRGGYVDQLPGSVASGVAAAAECPVVIVRAAQDTGGSGIVLGLDLSAPEFERHERAAIEFAMREAEVRDVTLRFLAADRGWPGPRPPGTLLQDYANHAASQLGDRLLALTKACSVANPGLDLTGDVTTGHPVEILIEASRKAELLVVGRRSRGSGLQLGSVAHGVLYHAACTVAIVP